jgi:hypothetical protein
VASGGVACSCLLKPSAAPALVRVVAITRKEQYVLVSDLRAERGNVRDLPCLDHLPIAEMGYYRLIDPKATPRPIDTGEARRHRAADHCASHLEVAVDNDFLHVVAKVETQLLGEDPPRCETIASGVYRQLTLSGPKERRKSEARDRQLSP